MRYIVRFLAWAVLIGLLALAPELPAMLPSTGEGIATRVYESWAGVLRVWVCVPWPSGTGSLSRWINQQAARFEKRNPGVYVQLTSVDEQSLRDFASGPAPAPDVVIFAGGMLTRADNLLPLSSNDALLESLCETGVYNEAIYARPLAMGGYAWAVRTDYLTGSPVGQSVSVPSREGEEAVALLGAPADAPYVCWSGALLALLTATPERAGEKATRAPAGEGIDLGLATATPAPSPTPDAQPLSPQFFAPSSTGPDFRQAESVTNQFAQGQIAAMPVSPAQIYKLSRMSEAGQLANYQIIGGEYGYTDLIAFAAVVDCERANRQARARLSADLIDLLLDDAAQQALGDIGLLRVTQGAALYAPASDMAVLERAYLERAFDCPNAFDGQFRIQAAARLDRLLGR